MFENFTATDRWTKKQVHCVYQSMIVAIATRHADAVDIKFLAGGRKVWVSLPHPAWVEYKKRTRRSITDPLALEIAGHLQPGDIGTPIVAAPLVPKVSDVVREARKLKAY